MLTHSSTQIIHIWILYGHFFGKENKNKYLVIVFYLNVSMLSVKVQ